jgi:ankyrin repeat protein
MTSARVSRTVGVLTSMIWVVGCAGPVTTPLHNAARNNDAVAVRAALAKGENVDTRDVDEGTPLIEAAKSGSVDVTNALLAAGAKVEVKDKDGFTPLMYAARNGYTEVVKILLDHGADINYRDPKVGLSAYDLARERARADTMQYLLSRGAK